MSAAAAGWSVPKFTKTFEGVRFQQGGDAKFEARIEGEPRPEVSWTRQGYGLSTSEKHVLEYDPSSGVVSLTIRQIGPGDEGAYSCTARNPYGETTATMNVCPDKSYKKGHRSMKMSDTRLTLQQRGRERAGAAMGDQYSRIM